MNFYADDSPIIACSTGSSTNTAIALLRLSGFKNLAGLQKFFSLNLSKVKNRTSHLANIIFGDEIFDNGLIVFFPEGKSFTGENLLEISIHGNQLNVQRILELFTREGGFRLAHAGEFTYRALVNKKLNLSQVEGLDMLLNANSHLMLSQGLDILQGDLHSQYLALYDSFLKLKAAVEISIDFSEDIGGEEAKELLESAFSKFFKQISSLKVRTEGHISSLLSPEVVLVGQTNAGKSSLFNILLKDERSIVSSIAGTTRDYVSEVVAIGGTNFRLVDTAGIRESSDVIENIGIDRALTILSRAFYRILIVNPFETRADYLAKFSDVTFDDLILSHADRVGFLEKCKSINFAGIKVRRVGKAGLKESGSIEPLSIPGPMGPLLVDENSGPIEPLAEGGSIGPKKEHGPIEPVLKKGVLEKFKAMSAHNPILLERHRDCINKIYNNSTVLHNNINKIDDVAILSSEVNILGDSLSELIGIVSPDEVLNSIFANFCIGK